MVLVLFDIGNVVVEAEHAITHRRLQADDNPGNNEMAEKHGWQTLLYKYPEQLRQDLEKRGIL